MSTRGRGFFRRGGPHHASNSFAEQEMARKEAEKDAREAEKKRKEGIRMQAQKAKEARRAVEDALWPEIKVDYTPRLWRQKYQQDHAATFSHSVEILQRIRDCSREEAKEILLEILVKITAVESNLTVNGCQTAEDLFDNLQLAQENEPTIPFASPEDVAAFCDSMPLNFRKEAGRFRNTGVQGRRLVQWLKTRLELGDVVDETRWEGIYEKFCETIKVEESRRTFANKEAGLDYSSLWFMAKKIPGFAYDKANGRLSLTSEAVESLALNLPIFTDTINSDHPRKLDFSRQISGFATNVYTQKIKTEIYLNDELAGMSGPFFCKTIDVQPETLDKPFSLIHGFVRNQNRSPVEVFSAEPTYFCALNNMNTKAASSTMVGGDLEALNFHVANINSQYHEDKVYTRQRVPKREKNLKSPEGEMNKD